MLKRRGLVCTSEGVVFNKYGQVLGMLVDGRCEAMYMDNTTHLCDIAWIVTVVAGNIILVGLHCFKHGKNDLMLKYTPREARLLKAYGELSENIGLNEGEDEDE